jgi:hypothetical protein
MLKLKVDKEDAYYRICGIPHNTCRKGVDRHWQPTEDGTVPAQSVCWLFCWGCWHQEDTAAYARQVFDAILEVSHEQFTRKIPESVARRLRYRNGDVEQELSKYFDLSSSQSSSS